jgi:uncharacterized glyoxalase superfamily protein PhnB
MVRVRKGGREMGEETEKRMTGVTPLLQVGSIPETIEYYQQVLGFSVDYIVPVDAPPKWAMVSRDGVHFMFTIDLGTSTGWFIAEKGNGVVFYVTTDDIEGLYAEFVERDAIIVQNMRTFGGRKQFSIADPNAYVIAFTEPLLNS